MVSPTKNINVAVVPRVGMVVLDEWKVEITINKRVTHTDPEVYNGYNAQTKMYEYYKYYYDKSNI